MRQACASHARKVRRILLFHALAFSRAASSGRSPRRRQCSSTSVLAARVCLPSTRTSHARLPPLMRLLRRRGERLFACLTLSLPHASTAAAISFAAFAMWRRRSSGREMRQAVRGRARRQGHTTLGLPSVWRAVLSLGSVRARHRQRRIGVCCRTQREWGKTPCALHSLRSPLLPGHSLMAHSPPPCTPTSRSTAAAMPAASACACVRTGRSRRKSRGRTLCSRSRRSSAPPADSALHAAQRAPCASPPPPPPSAGASRCRAAHPAALRFRRSARVRSVARAWRDEGEEEVFACMGVALMFLRRFPMLVKDCCGRERRMMYGEDYPVQV